MWNDTWSGPGCSLAVDIQVFCISTAAFAYQACIHVKKKKRWEKNPTNKKKKELERQANSLARPTFHYIFSLWFYFSQYNSGLTVSLFVQVEIKFNWSRILWHNPFHPFQNTGFSLSSLLQSCFMLGIFFWFYFYKDVKWHHWCVLGSSLNCSNWKSYFWKIFPHVLSIKNKDGLNHLVFFGF